MFQLISSIIAVIALTKAVSALLLPDRFYGWRKRQYDSTAIPRIVLVLPLLFLFLAAVTWYATLVAYQPYGWIVTGFTTLIAILGSRNLSRWSSHRQQTGAAIATQLETRTRVDIAILLLGLFFAGLALFIY